MNSKELSDYYSSILELVKHDRHPVLNVVYRPLLQEISRLSNRCLSTKTSPSKEELCSLLGRVISFAIIHLTVYPQGSREFIFNENIQFAAAILKELESRFDIDVDQQEVQIDIPSPMPPSRPRSALNKMFTSIKELPTVNESDESIETEVSIDIKKPIPTCRDVASHVVPMSALKMGLSLKEYNPKDPSHPNKYYKRLLAQISKHLPDPNLSFEFLLQFERACDLSFAKLIGLASRDQDSAINNIEKYIKTHQTPRYLQYALTNPQIIDMLGKNKLALNALIRVALKEDYPNLLAPALKIIESNKQYHALSPGTTNRPDYSDLVQLSTLLGQMKRHKTETAKLLLNSLYDALSDKDCIAIVEQLLGDYKSEPEQNGRFFVAFAFYEQAQTLLQRTKKHHRGILQRYLLENTPESGRFIGHLIAKNQMCLSALDLFSFINICIQHKCAYSLQALLAALPPKNHDLHKNIVDHIKAKPTGADVYLHTMDLIDHAAKSNSRKCAIVLALYYDKNNYIMGKVPDHILALICCRRELKRDPTLTRASKTYLPQMQYLSLLPRGPIVEEPSPLTNNTKKKLVRQ